MKQYQGHLEISKEALIQIYSIKNNDYTLAECEFRIRIDGKGCAGFTYDMGFSPMLSDDHCLEIPTKTRDPLRVIMDPFTAHYVQTAHLDFKMNEDENDIGFVLTNFNEKTYEGKFFEDESLLPR